MHDNRPWEQLKELIDVGSAEEIRTYLNDLKSDDIVGAVSHINSDDRHKFLSMLSPVEAATVLSDLPSVQAMGILNELETTEAAHIIAEMRSDDQADFLSEMDPPDVEEILTQFSRPKAENLRKLIKYDAETAGGLMITEFLAFPEFTKVGDVVDDLRDNAREYEKYSLQYIYVTSQGKFIGVLRMRDLLLSNRNTTLARIVIRGALAIQDTDSFEEVVRFFDTHDFYGVPVLNEAQELIGVVLQRQVRVAIVDHLNVEHLETQGIVGGEELRTMPVLLRSKRRLSWLSANILLNILAASIIAFYQDTLSAVIALAVFLPIISDMSGCSGNQAVAVSLRELSLGVVKPFEVMRVGFQEASVGIINGLVLGLLIGTAAWLWQGNVYLGLVVGSALAINTLAAVTLGGTIPLILKSMKVDPALASGPLLTTVTDMLGFFLTLTFAGAMLSQLT